MRSQWPKVELGTLLTQVWREERVDASKEYRLLGARWYGDGLFSKETKSGRDIRATSLYRVEAGDFVYNRLFAWRGSFAVATANDDGAYVSNEFPCFAVRPESADPQFLWWYFRRQSAWTEALGLSSGATPTSRNRLKERLFLKMAIPLPPLAEQRRIVTRIEKLGAEINEARGLRKEVAEEAATLTRSRARSLLSGIALKSSRLEHWLDPDREGIQTGPFGAQLSSADFTESGVPLLTIGNVQFAGLNKTNLKFVSQDKARELSRYRVREGDIVFARMGTVGRCCVVPGEASGWLINYHIIRVALDASRVDARFIHWTIQASADIETYLEGKIRGATREGVNSSIVAGLPCRVPPLSEQRRIVAELEGFQANVEALRRLQAETAAELAALLPSVLDKAFRGEL